MGRAEPATDSSVCDPTHAVDTNPVNSHLPQPMFDYPQETGRTAMDLITNGILRAYPEVKIILSHAGGTLPWLINRSAALLPHTPMDIGLSTEDILGEARKFYASSTLILLYQLPTTCWILCVESQTPYKYFLVVTIRMRLCPVFSYLENSLILINTWKEPIHRSQERMHCILFLG